MRSRATDIARPRKRAQETNMHPPLIEDFSHWEFIGHVELLEAYMVHGDADTVDCSQSSVAHGQERLDAGGHNFRPAAKRVYAASVLTWLKR